MNFRAADLLRLLLKRVHIAPVDGGGLQVELTLGEHYFEIELSMDGKASFLVMDGDAVLYEKVIPIV